MKNLEKYLRDALARDDDYFVMHVSIGPNRQLLFTITPEFDMRQRQHATVLVDGDHCRIVTASETDQGQRLI